MRWTRLLGTSFPIARPRPIQRYTKEKGYYVLRWKTILEIKLPAEPA